jgi:hypothetical protein
MDWALFAARCQMGAWPHARNLESWRPEVARSVLQAFSFPDSQVAARCGRPDSGLRPDRMTLTAERSLLQQCGHPPQRLGQSIGPDRSDLLRDRRCQFASSRREISHPLGARVQYRLRIAIVADGPEGQAIRVAQSVDRAVDARRERQLVCRATCSCSYHSCTLRHAGGGYPLDISYSIGHSTTLYGIGGGDFGVYRARKTV